MKLLKLRFHFLLLFFTFSIAYSEAQKTFNVGDRVLVSPSGLKDEKFWKPGTVTEVHNLTPKKAYSVSVDNGSGYLVNADWIKELPVEEKADNNDAMAAPVNQNPPKKPVGQKVNNKVIENQPPARPQPIRKNLNGNVPTQPDLEAWMDKYVAKQAQPNSDGAITYEIKSFRVGSPRKWQFNDGGNPPNGHNTTVYPVRVEFLQKTHYRTMTHVVDRNCVFTAFKDGFGEWSFSYSADPQTQTAYDEAPDM
ncbi:MAG: hypothetical protein M3004_07350 [Bacteroidota bacterium]|nr:hypothetical protein [Bacteroidota bacterium]